MMRGRLFHLESNVPSKTYHSTILTPDTATNNEITYGLTVAFNDGTVATIQLISAGPVCRPWIQGTWTVGEDRYTVLVDQGTK